MTRRSFLLQASAASSATMLSATLLAKAQAPQAANIPNRDTVLKFNPDGTPRHFAGNTVICHLLSQCVLRDVMVELHEAMKTSSFKSKLGLTSTDSYHMTVFPGANDLARNVYGWPSYVPADATIERCNEMVGERIAAARFHCELPLRMRIDASATSNYSTALSLRLVPVDDAENRKLRALRDELAEVFGFRTKDHATYQFHMTMSYQIGAFTAREQSDYRAMIGAYAPRMVKAAPVLELACPEYCTFEDMFRFEPRKLLACS
ncbi:hypothetical protein SAMN05421819_0972 [Bryocella elongata]|uniref:DUF1868 domain-containing protein n=1 Tax=Bryocella elongata TaxID=863522 RepID=A0A1H5UCV3_9BACT|nr:DUF1868 domain-containing protein [Bryocella elongata]SEF72965.1 hypothetical protein SAMN05421819_0972 [Bryocella elongata]